MEERATTPIPGTLVSATAISSVRPSAKKSWFASPAALTKGSTAKVGRAAPAACAAHGNSDAQIANAPAKTQLRLTFAKRYAIAPRPHDPARVIALSRDQSKARRQPALSPGRFAEIDRARLRHHADRRTHSAAHHYARRPANDADPCADSSARETTVSCGGATTGEHDSCQNHTRDGSHVPHSSDR